MSILEAMDNVLRTTSLRDKRTGYWKVRKKDWLEVLLVRPTGRYADTVEQRSYRGFPVTFGDLEDAVSACFVFDPAPPPNGSNE